MAYETGSAASPRALIDRIEAFLGTIVGAVVHERNTLTSYNPTREILRFTLPGGTRVITVGYRRNVSTLPEAETSRVASGFRLAMASSFSGSGLDIADLPDSFPISNSKAWETNDACLSNTVLEQESIPVYHFAYHPGGVLMVSYLGSDGYWSHFAAGELEKYGNYVGGAILLGNNVGTSTSWFGYPDVAFKCQFGLGSGNTNTGPKLHCEYNGVTYWDVRSGIDNNGIPYYAAGSLDTSVGISSTTNASSLVTRLLPLEFGVDHESSPSGERRAVPIGYLRDVRFTTIRYFEAGDIFDTDWLILPITRKTPHSVNNPDGTGVPASGYFGLAIRIA